MYGGCNTENLSHFLLAKEKTYRNLQTPDLSPTALHSLRCFFVVVVVAFCFLWVFLAFFNMNICDNFLTRQTLSIEKVKYASVASGIAENGSEQEVELISQGGLMCVAQMLWEKEQSDGWMVVKQQKRETCIRATDFHLYVT